MPALSAHKCHIGRRRKKNQDFVWVDEQTGLYILADGMGGHESGEIASQLAVITIGKLIINQIRFETIPLSAIKIKEVLTAAIEAGSETVFKAAQEAAQRRGMGTTIVVVLLQSSTAYISHVGDSRAYLARNNALTQLTEDHTWVAQFKKAASRINGQVNNYLSHILTQAVGQETLPRPSFMEMPLTPGDWLLLCSDGLWNMVEDEQTLALLQQAGKNPGRAVEALVTAANEAGGKDNISVVAIKIVGDEPQPAMVDDSTSEITVAHPL